MQAGRTGGKGSRRQYDFVPKLRSPKYGIHDADLGIPYKQMHCDSLRWPL